MAFVSIHMIKYCCRGQLLAELYLCAMCSPLIKAAMLPATNEFVGPQTIPSSSLDQTMCQGHGL